MTDIEQALEYIDFVDKNIGIMVGMYNRRKQIYRQKGVEM